MIITKSKRVWECVIDEGKVVTIVLPRRNTIDSDMIVPAMLNWSAWGSQSPEVAQEFAESLYEASIIAKMMNLDVEKYLVE